MSRYVLFPVAAVAAGIACAIALLVTVAAANPQPGLPPPPETVARSTPRETLHSFTEAARKGDFTRAAYLLDLRDVPRHEQPTEGPRLARQLRYVLARKIWIDPGALSDDPGGRREDGLLTERIGEISLHGSDIPIALTRVPMADGGADWVVSQATVRAIPELYEEYGPGWLGERLPAWAHKGRFAQLAIWQWIGLVVALGLAIVGAFVIAALVLSMARRLTRHTRSAWDDRIVGAIRGPTRAFVGLSIFGVAINIVHLPLSTASVFSKVVGSLAMGSVAWFAMRVIHAISETIADRLVQDQTDEVVIQGTRMRVAVTRRIINGLVLVIGAAVALTQFEVVRRVGVSVLASAGIAGIALGFAAQKVLGNVLAGLQVSMAQPIRIGDRVFIEGQFGFVEEISLTYVIVKTWDERRLVLPITHIVEKPFENWTRTNPQLVGVVIVYADYRVPVQRVREKFEELVRADPAWDGEVLTVVVLDMTERTLSIRCTASARADVVWDLRCRTREGLVTFLQELDGGRYLPRTRVELPKEGEIELAGASAT